MPRGIFAVRVSCLLICAAARAQEPRPPIPKVWDDSAIASLLLPLAGIPAQAGVGQPRPKTVQRETKTRAKPDGVRFKTSCNFRVHVS